MRRTAVALVLALVGGVTTGGLASGSQSRSDQIRAVENELKGLTRISGTRTASAVVVLPRAVAIRPRALNDTVAHIEGTGPLAGMVLRQDARHPVELLALSIDPCTSPPCRQRRVAWNMVRGPHTQGRRAMLPAGRYFLYFIAEGGPAEVVLRLDGLEGQTTIRAEGPALSSFDQLDAGAAGETAAPIYRATGAFDLARFGIAIAALELEAAPHLAGRYYSCLRPTVEPVPADAFSLTCAGGVGSWTIITPDTDDSVVRLVSITSVTKGTYAQTVGLQAAAVAESVSSFGFSLSFNGSDSGDSYESSGISYETP